MSEHYPKPKIPILPVLSWRSFFSAAAITPPDVTTRSRSLPLASGAAAITLALQHGGVKPGAKVLVPAFHCQSMVEPVVAVSAEPVFYKVKENLEIDLDDIETKADDSCRAIIAAHYFGFPQDLKSLRAYCDSNNLILIEDCAHMYFGEVGDRSVADFGDYAIASTRKFFPVFDGGELISQYQDVKCIPLASPGGSYQLKSMINIIEQAVAYGRLRPFGPLFRILFFIKDALWGSKKRLENNNDDVSEEAVSSPEFTYIDMAKIDRAMSIPSRLIKNLTSRPGIVRQRRENYLYMLKELSNLSQARPLYPALPEKIVPYMFPLIIDQPDKHFPELKNQGVPIWRWEDLTPSDCVVSRNYSRCLLQLPCHQELRDKELGWMIGVIRDVLL